MLFHLIKSRFFNRVDYYQTSRQCPLISFCPSGQFGGTVMTFPNPGNVLASGALVLTEAARVLAVGAWVLAEVLVSATGLDSEGTKP